MNALQFASAINATASHVLDGACAHISVHMTESKAGFGVVVYDAANGQMHQLPMLSTREDASRAIWALRDAFYEAATPATSSARGGG